MTMVGRMVPDDVDHRRTRAACVMQIRYAVAETRTEVQQRRRRDTCHARVSVGGAGDHALEQAEHTTHVRVVIERSDKMHFRGAGIGKTCGHPSVHERLHERFGTVHLSPPR